MFPYLVLKQFCKTSVKLFYGYARLWYPPFLSVITKQFSTLPLKFTIIKPDFGKLHFRMLLLSNLTIFLIGSIIIEPDFGKLHFNLLLAPFTRGG